ncbi:MlaE family ABC transporter permease [Mycobacterium sp.]|uniref:MlaE family ABC transporter permease n=1 Tax=Mycobacterium sp. TaxID=1785 RepID=UPI003D0CB67A
MKPLNSLGGFFAMSLDAFVLIPRRPFALREFLLQCWFIARVSLVPALLLAMPFTVLFAFNINVLLTDFGAGDFAGTGAGLALAQLGPIVTVLVVAGAASTAICADLGARTIREEIDALRVLGVNPVQSLVVPRVLAACVVAVLLSCLVSLATLVGSFVFSVFIQHVTPGAYVGGLTLLTGTTAIFVSVLKAGLFGLAASLIGCYKGLSVGGGPTGVGTAVNETVVYSFVALFVINVIVTAGQFSK